MLSEKLYQINKMIGFYWIALKQKPTMNEIQNLNILLGECIKEARELEKKE